ncbi:hypothetical protein FACS1894139_17250 [Planctomycetales bacterium]|nr:hypothetical protein FACS1894107_06220 [Planctomycetales bacterium]GHT08069.1 hypothetical protein FACS1894139_17250 [Planctomycetales bacterium]
MKTKCRPSLLWLTAHRYAVAATVGSLTLHAGVFLGVSTAAPSPREFTATQVGIVAVDLSPAALAQIFPAAAEPETSTETSASVETPEPPETPEPETAELAETPAPETPPLSEPPPVAASPAETAPVAAQNLANAGVAAATSPEVIAGSNRRPTYPEAARRRRQEGTVWLRLEIDARGAVRTATVDASSGYPLLDEAAVRAARQWRFRPATRFGQPAADTVRAPVEFHLR